MEEKNERENIEQNKNEEKPKIEIKPDEKKYKKEFKSFFDNFTAVIPKTLYSTKQSQKAHSTKVRGYLTTILKNGYSTMPEIQSYLSGLSKNKPADKDLDARIIQTILNSRAQGTKVYFNSNLFKRPISEFLYAFNVSTKCLSNDYLYLLTVCKQIIENYNIKPSILKGAIVNSVKIISDNFVLNENIRKGIIQDYDPRFSVLCTKKITADAVVKAINDQENEGEFEFDNYKFKYYGTEDLSVVKLADLSTDDVAEKFEKMVYLKVGANKFSEGEKTIPFNDEIHYVDVQLTPEDFCPCFWTSSDTAIKVNYMFEIHRDFSTLFEEIEKSGKEEKLWMPANMCYWPFINQCFDFLSVLALTGLEIPEDKRMTIARYCDMYYTLKPYIRKWKENQMLLERILREYCTYFLNHSELIRFYRLIDKCKKYLAVQAYLKKQATLYDAMKNMFEQIPFAQMINKQLDNPCTNLVTKILSSLTTLTTGTKITLQTEIRNIIQEIHSLLPAEMNLTPTFPFIVADGGLNGSAVNVPRDYIGFGVAHYQDVTSKKKIKQKSMEQSFSKEYAQHIELEKKFIEAYFTDRLKNVKLEKDFDMKALVAVAMARKTLNENDFDDIFKGVMAFKELKNPDNFSVTARKKIPLLEKIVEERIKGAANMNLEESDSGEEEESEDEDKKEELIITDNKKGKVTKYKKLQSSNIASPSEQFNMLAKKVSRVKSKGKRKKKAGYTRALKGLGP